MAGQNILAKAAATVAMNPAKFKTGSDGFRGQGKVIEDGVKYQVQVIAVRLTVRHSGGKVSLAPSPQESGC